MSNYLARYIIWADQYDAGFMLPDYEPHKPEWSFEANDLKEALGLAETHLEELKKNYFNPRDVSFEVLEVGSRVVVKDIPI